MTSNKPIVTLTKKSAERDYSEFFDGNKLDRRDGFKIKNRAIILPK
jgi:hypothetical protein